MRIRCDRPISSSISHCNVPDCMLMRVPPIPFSRFAKGVKGVMKSLASLEMQNETQLSIRIALESESNLATSFGLTWEALMAMVADIAFSELMRLRFCLVFTLRRTISWGLRHRDVGVLVLEVLIRTCRLLRVLRSQSPAIFAYRSVDWRP